MFQLNLGAPFKPDFGLSVKFGRLFRSGKNWGTSRLSPGFPLRVDTEVVDWFKSKGPGYQTRINRILRRVMMEGKKRTGER